MPNYKKRTIPPIAEAEPVKETIQYSWTQFLHVCMEVSAKQPASDPITDVYHPECDRANMKFGSIVVKCHVGPQNIVLANGSPVVLAI